MALVELDEALEPASLEPVDVELLEAVSAAVLDDVPDAFADLARLSVL